jgi:xylan 1,4-beta-xylosidase
MVKDGVRGMPDVAALASRDGRTVSVLAWHYHDDDVAGPEAAVTLAIAGLPAGDRSPRVRAYRVDADHGNAFTAWTRMGSPAAPTPAQYAELERAGHLAEVEPPRAASAGGGRVTLRLVLPRQSVALVVADW